MLQKVFDLLSSLDDPSVLRILKTVATYYDLRIQSGADVPHGHASQPSVPNAPNRLAAQAREPHFGSHQALSPKDFLFQKDPQSDVDRVVCLAYYLAHFHDLPHFKTSDISKLNTEAAQRKFANTAYTVNNATMAGYLAPAPGGLRQLSAKGEQYVEALPDRSAAKAVLERFRPARKSKRSRKKPRD